MLQDLVAQTPFEGRMDLTREGKPVGLDVCRQCQGSIHWLGDERRCGQCGLLADVPRGFEKKLPNGLIVPIADVNQPAQAPPPKTQERQDTSFVGQEFAQKLEAASQLDEQRNSRRKK
jgi:hypothetical protein